ncbi:MAG: Wzz/FepE/Etk N-terminal domain-containing protein [Terracidiphilus sp.]
MPTDVSLRELEERHDPTAPAAGPIKRDSDEISLVDLLIVLAERKRVILWVTAAFAILAIIISLVLPKRYTATATILPQQQYS